MINIKTVNDLFDLLLQKKIKYLYISASPNSTFSGKYSITIETFDGNRVEFKNDELQPLLKNIEKYLNA